MTNHQATVLRQAIEVMYHCLNNRILGSGANPSDDWNFRQECIAACEQAKRALFEAGI